MRAEDLQTSGKMDGDALSRLPTSAKGVLYLATDEGTDRGVEPAGFATLQQSSNELTLAHVPLSVKNLRLQDADAALASLASLPSPTLLACASGGRASAVKCLAKAMQDELGVDATLQWARSPPLPLSCLSPPSPAPAPLSLNMNQDELGVDATLQWAREQNLPFLKNDHLRDWVLASVAKREYAGRPLLVRPLYEETSWTYSYVIACPKTMEGVIIDPVDLTVDRDVDVCREMGVTLKYAINTHCHADHVTGSGLLHQKLPGCASVIAEASGAVATLKIKNGDRLHFGERYLECRATPGHTDGCMSFVTDDYSMVFTGDALLIRGCGRTDFQQGSPVSLYHSIHTQIFSLPADTLVYPGHDYKGRLFTTIGEEKRFNPRLAGTTEAQFVEIMHNLKLAYPKKIDQALPSNKVDGMLGHQ